MAVRRVATVRVERKHIDAGRPEQSEGCPIYLALKPMLREGCVLEVVTKHLYLYLPASELLGGRSCKKVVPLPATAENFIKGFDCGCKAMLGYLVEPFEFVLVDRGLEIFLKPECLEKKIPFFFKAAGRELDGRTWDEMPQIGV